MLGGLTVNVVPATQNEYGVSCTPSEIESTLSATV
jgi:hypothetical protein